MLQEPSANRIALSSRPVHGHHAGEAISRRQSRGRVHRFGSSGQKAGRAFSGLEWTGQGRVYHWRQEICRGVIADSIYVKTKSYGLFYRHTEVACVEVVVLDD